MAPRRAALGILLAVRRGIPFDVALDKLLNRLSDRDRRLAHQLSAGVLRNSATLDGVLSPLLSKGLAKTDQKVLDILRLGSFQLLHLERVPRHAAVGTAVGLTREAVGEKATGFVNAVLRRVSIPEGQITQNSADDTQSLALEFSHPDWLVSRWLDRFGVEATRGLLTWNNQQAPLVVQPATSLDELSERFNKEAVRFFQAPLGAGLVVEETHPDRLPGFDEGLFYVQDPAQSLVTRFASFPAGVAVYDACAAPGGKTMALSRHAQWVVAADSSRHRLERVRENLRRTRRDNSFLIAADALYPPIRKTNAFLLDAPCLGTGTFARHPDARLRVSVDALDRIVSTQARLLDAAAPLMEVGGVLCYATCSLEQEENIQQVDAFLARHSTFRRQPPEELGLPMNHEGDLTILPHREGMDGAFAARLVRVE